MATTTAASEEPKKEDTKITKESILDDVISDIDRLEKDLKSASAKSLKDLLVFCYNMPSKLMAASLRLDVIKGMLENEGVIPRAWNISDLD
jgi:hypothetical protein